MAEAGADLEGPDFEKGCRIETVPDQGMLLGHAFGEAILVAKKGDQLFAIGATCTHYGGPLAKGLMVGNTVRCPWHHACFDLRTGEAIAAPALNDVARYKVEKRGEHFFVTAKANQKPVANAEEKQANTQVKKEFEKVISKWRSAEEMEEAEIRQILDWAIVIGAQCLACIAKKGPCGRG